MGRCTVVKSATIVKRSWNQEKCTLPWPWFFLLILLNLLNKFNKINRKNDTLNRPASESYLQSSLVWHKSPIFWNGSWPSSSGLRGRRRTYHTILKLADHALSKMVRYVHIRVRNWKTFIKIHKLYFHSRFSISHSNLVATSYFVCSELNIDLLLQGKCVDFCIPGV
jgi:hypothetical protein